MLSIQILAVGGLGEDYLRAACGEYLKRLGAFCRPTVREIAEARLPGRPGEGDIRRCLEAEGDKLLAQLPARAFVAALCVEGAQMSSESLAAKLLAIPQSYGEIAFVIGGSHGLSRRVKDRADLRLSLSAMTFPHQLARILLLEQLYRAFSINGGGRYHK